MVKNISEYNTNRSQRKQIYKGRTIVLGLTGGIACGKSLACHFFRELGAAVLSADELAREAVLPGSEAFKKIVAHFGKEILTTEGTINRVLLAERVFSTPSERQELNRITHPAIARLATLRISELLKNTDIPLIIYEAPLLFEAKAEDRVDLILVVATTAEQQLTWLMERDKLTREEALQRIATQMPLAEKIARADILVENNAHPAEMQEMIGRIFVQLTAGMKKNPPITGDLHCV